MRRILLVTGLSGSGKSTALHALEDCGYFCIDNLPAPLLLKVAELGTQERLALGIDVRERHFLKDVPQVLDDAAAAGLHVDIVFLDSSDGALERRYSETRRKHPLSTKGTVADGISLEREALKGLRERANHVIDTTALSVHDLRQEVLRRFSEDKEGTMAVSLVSFGFKHGLPSHADLVFDVRFVPNPFFVEALKKLSGKDPEVARFVLERTETKDFLTHLEGMLHFLLPHYQKENKAYLTVAIGCTGGRHRSVAIAAALKERFPSFQLWDRDLHRES